MTRMKTAVSGTYWQNAVNSALENHTPSSGREIHSVITGHVMGNRRSIEQSFLMILMVGGFGGMLPMVDALQLNRRGLLTLVRRGPRNVGSLELPSGTPIYAKSALHASVFRRPSEVPDIADEMGAHSVHGNGVTGTLPPSSSNPSGVSANSASDNDYFDPLGLANDDTFPIYREAELKHGRVAMLASVGMVVPDVLLRLDFPLLCPGAMFCTKVGSGAATGAAPVHVPPGLGALGWFPFETWVALISAIGAVDAVILVQREADAMPGDYGVGYLGLRDKARHER